MKPSLARADQPLRRQKIRDRAFVLPLAGLVMLIPPIAGIFQIEARVAGIPITLLYLFGAWALLIVGGAILAWELRVHLESVDDVGEPVEPTPSDDAVP